MSEKFEVKTVFEDEKRSCAEVQIHGLGERVVNETSANTYHLESGLAYFCLYRAVSVTGSLELTDTIILKPGGSIAIEPGTIYQDRASQAVMHCLSEPPFDPDSVTVVE